MVYFQGNPAPTDYAIVTIALLVRVDSHYRWDRVWLLPVSQRSGFPA